MAARRRTGAARKRATGKIRGGTEISEVAQHTFVPGASGTGTTTTLVRLVDGALANRCVVVIIDSKGERVPGDLTS
jgi:Type IV secretion-system coupling protein DNA-binding domain